MNLTQHQESFIQIIDQHKRILYKVIHAYCQDTDDRKDLEQEILIQLWKSLKTYKPDFKLSTWIYKVALHVAISHYRKDSRRKERNEPLENSIFQLNGEEDVPNDPRADLLYRCIGQLDKISKAIMILYLEDNSYQEIAQLMGMSESNVGTKINRIKAKMKEDLNNQNPY